MEKRRSYTQLRPEDRVVIAGMTQLGASVRAMARALKRSPSTLSRELARNRSPADAAYASQAAHARHTARRVAARPPRKLDPEAVSWGVVRTLLVFRKMPDRRRRVVRRPVKPWSVSCFPGRSTPANTLRCLRQTESRLKGDGSWPTSSPPSG